MDCGQRLDLGKRYCFTEDHPDGVYVGDQKQWALAEISPGLSGYSLSDPKYLIDSWRMLQHFLIKHRGHELRLLPESLVTRYSTDRKEDVIIHMYDDSVESFLSQSVGDPDLQEDVSNVSEDVLRRLEALQRKAVK